MGGVGARGVVHTPQFNGKQESYVARSTRLHLRCPATVKRTSFHELRFCQLATERLEQAFGKATKVVSVSPDTGQQGGDAPKRRR
jgi:hypothetical protein